MINEISSIVLKFLGYNPEAPLIFTGLSFWIFFALVLLVYSIVYKHNKLRVAFLFLASIFFYYKTSGFFFSILLFSTVADFFIGNRIYKSQLKTTKKTWLVFSILINLSVLVFFKYSYFFTDTFNAFLGTNFEPINVFAKWTNELTGSTFRVDKILLPVGISFYTFQTISYVVDLYREKVKPVKNIIDFGFYVSFFPQLVAGPIVRASEFIPQIYEKYHISKRDFGMGMFWIFNGLIKKLYLADFIAINFVDRVFEDPLRFSGIENLFALYGYSIQVYADFSGYTDMAIGIALLMGFRLPKNFDSPYKAVNTGDFWKRWHISLSSWLKDYLYIPLGGNRTIKVGSIVLLFVMFVFASLLAGNLMILAFCSGVMLILFGLGYIIPQFKSWLTTNTNIMITMLIGGLWHGASWNFVIWGGLNGLGIVVYKLWRQFSPWERKNNFLKRFIAIFLTFNFITFTRIWFRSGSNNTWENLNDKHLILEELQAASDMLNQMIYSFNYQIFPEFVLANWKVLTVMLLGFIIHWMPKKYKNWYREAFIRMHWSLKALAGFIVVFLAIQILNSDIQPFIYFQF